MPSDAWSHMDRLIDMHADVAERRRALELG
jgi:hypothetical protein